MPDCLFCAKELGNSEARFCDDYCAHAWLVSKDRWLFLEGMGMYRDLDDPDDRIFNTIHNLNAALQMELASQ